jgi:hypothetical protein
LNTKFEKNWRLPLAGEPIFVNGAVSPGPSRGPDGTARKTHSTNTTLVTATNTMHGANSKLWLTPLLPSARDVIKIGQAVVTGQVPLWEDMYGRVTEDGQAPERHQANSAPWRIEVVSATGSLTDSFLNVIEVTDNGGGQSPTETIRGQRFVGARVGDRIAVFAEQSNRETTGSFTVPTAGSYRILVGGLVPGGEYNVTYGGFSARETAPASGTVVLDATVVANTTFTLQATGAVATLPPAAPQNVRVIGGP